MSQTQTLILTIGAFQGLLLFVLLISDRRVNYASKVLGFYCLLLVFNLLLPLIIAAGKSRFSWLIGPTLFLPASYGALSYLYCRTAMTTAPLRHRDCVHLLPLLICYLLNYDILLSGESALNFVAAPIEATAGFKLMLVIILYGLAVFYSALLARMIYRYQTKAKQTLSSYNPNTFNWHWTLLIATILIWSLKALSNLTSNGASLNFVADCTLVILIYFFAVVQWYNPSLFHIENLKEQLDQPAAPSGLQRSDGVLNEEMRSNVLMLVQQEVEEQALYRNSELTLAMLAQQVGVSVHQLSESLNKYGGKNFNQFINEYRVTEVCQQLDQKSKRKLIDLALDAGFSSKSSFNAIFKKLVGKTPSAYRDQSVLE